MMFAGFREDVVFSLRHPRVRYSMIGFVLSALLALITGAIIWWPAIHGYQRLNTEIEGYRREIAGAEYEARLADRSGLAAQQVAVIEKKLDTSVTQAALVQNIAALAHKYKVKILSESYDEAKPENGYAPLAHDLTVQAGYTELRGFIAGLQQLPTLTVVQEANLARSANSTLIKAQLNIVTYRRAMGGDS